MKADQIEMKTCIDSDHKGENPLPLSEFYRARTTADRRQSYCRHCTVRRVYEHRHKKELKVTDGYLDRHLQKRARELALAESFLPTQENFCFVERKPMFRGLTDGYLRQPTNKHSWRVA